MFVDPFAEVEEELAKEREVEIEKVSCYKWLLLLSLLLLLLLFMTIVRG